MSAANAKAQAQAGLLMMKGLISEMPPEQQAKVEGALTEIRATMAKYGEESLVALAIIGLESEAE